MSKMQPEIKTKLGADQVQALVSASLLGQGAKEQVERMVSDGIRIAPLGRAAEEEVGNSFKSKSCNEQERNMNSKFVMAGGGACGWFTRRGAYATEAESFRCRCAIAACF